MVLVQPFLGCIATGTTSRWQQSHLKPARQPSWSRAEVFVAKGNKTPAESSLWWADNSPDSHDQVKATHHLQWVSGDPDVSQITFFYKTWHSSKFVIEDVCLLKRNVHFMEPNTLIAQENMFYSLDAKYRWLQVYFRHGIGEHSIGKAETQGGQPFSLYG